MLLQERAQSTAGRLAAGTRLGPYEILAPLGAGGMGEVYKARDTRLKRTVAIKISSERFNERFGREARVVATLNHPHICTIYDVGPDYLVMEYIDGKPLRGPLPVDVAVGYAREIAEALDAAHRHGIVHRDLKPSNILVTRAGVKLLDFGIAQMTPARGPDADAISTQTLTPAGVIFGTPQYMAPEQIEGKPVDARADIFAFGAVFYEMLTGRRAFEGQSQAGVLAAILEREPPPLSHVPPAVEHIVRRCLAKDPEQRWQSAYDIAAVLELSVASPQAGPQKRLSARQVAVALTVLVVGFAAATFWFGYRSKSVDARSGLQLGGAAVSYGPRVSPDGQMVAFEALIDGQNQVAVLKPESRNWTVLTHGRKYGILADLCWSRDGTKIYFDRVMDTPVGVFSVPLLGGEERMVLEGAMGPQALADGSLVVVRINAARQWQLHRFWPASGRLQTLPARVEPPHISLPLRATADGKGVVFLGAPLVPKEPDGPTAIYTLELESGRLRPLAPGMSVSHADAAFPLAATADGRSVVVALLAGDLYRVLEIPRDGGRAIRLLFTLSLPVWYLDAAPNGDLYVDQVSRQAAILRFGPQGGIPERLASYQNEQGGDLQPLVDGRVAINLGAGEKRRVLVVQPGGDLAPLLETNEACWPPTTAVGDRLMAVMVGPERRRQIALVSIADGRILRRLEGPKGTISRMAASPDGQMLYYTASGFVWAVPVTDGEPRKIHEGDSVAADPNGRDLIVKLNEKDAYRLLRVPVSGAPAQPIDMRGELRPTPNPVSGSAVDAQGRIVLEAASTGSWFYAAALLDPKTGSFVKVPVQFDGDLWRPAWTRDGRIVAMGADMQAAIWRFPRDAAGGNGGK
ncbi:MAG: serine/threonine-protein kinase [Acidobacteriia bacterium]|nr:serine/threonine-protein kinase [Terriglobia bacterium]